MHDAVIIDAVRTPLGRGREDGGLINIHPTELLALTLKAIIERTGVDPGLVDDVIAGCASQVAEQAANIARSAVLSASFPETVPATTVDRRCGSSQQAIAFAAQGVMAGAYDLVIACGVEHMGRIPLPLSRMGKDNQGPGVARRYPAGLVVQGVSAELIAAKWGISRVELDAYALRSHELAIDATDSGRFARSMVPVKIAREGEIPHVMDTDEGIRRDTTAEKLAALRPAFRDNTLSARFPEIKWAITAGNSSQVTDGAAAVLIASAAKAKELGLVPRARLVSFSVVGSDPLMMLTGPIPATAKALSKAGLTIGDIDSFEVNEAFASVVLAWQRETNADMSRVNVNGGAIALGHPLGASGARLMTSLLDTLDESGGKFGLQVMCEGGGQANATIVERIA
jgi:acetyl-CoA acyltransferase